jgi:hypothetical protein
MPACYREIASLKQRERQLRISGFFNRIGERPLYPTWNELTGDMLVSRAEINQMANPDRQETHGEETTLEPSAVTVTNPCDKFYLPGRAGQMFALLATRQAARTCGRPRYCFDFEGVRK